MSAPSGPGRVVVVDPAPAEAALLGELSGRAPAPSADVERWLADGGDPVDLVVLGSAVASPLAVAQRVHRLVPDAAIAVVTGDETAVRRQASFAPEVPIDLLIAAPDDPDLPARLRQLRTSSAERRRHSQVLAAVARSAARVSGTGPTAQAAVGALLEHAPIGVLVTDRSGELLGWNRRAEDLLGLSPGLTGQPVEGVVPGAMALVTAVAATDRLGGEAAAGAPLRVRVAGRDLEITSVGSQTDDGRPVVLLLAVDVTAHRAAERERDRLARHVELLGEISELLMESLDPDPTLARLAGALAPALADWVAIEVRGDHEQNFTVAVHHSDPALADVLDRLRPIAQQRGPLTELCRRARTGDPVLLPDVGPGGLDAHVPDADIRALVRQLGAADALAVPIPGRLGVLGSLLLVRGPGRDPFGEPELSLAVEIGRRAGIALDNAQLYAGQRNVATELQRSLLTAPPVIPFADIAVRYVAAAQEAQVGGDWYDAFRRGDGDLVVVIGDVAGHDTRAAAAMGQIRAMLRGISYTTADRPADVLTRVDEAIEGLELATVATAVVAQVTPQGAREDGPPLRVAWSNAGHPPPVLIDPTAGAALLAPSSGRPDLLLGVDPARERSTERAVLSHGATLLLYTDGLVERRGATLDDGLAALIQTLERYAHESLDDLCDAVVRDLVPHAGDDDVAIVAVRPRDAPTMAD